MSAPRRGLGASRLKAGKGSNVGDLLAQLRERPEAPAVGELREVPPGEIRPNPWQPRRSFDPARLEELAESIRAQGLLQPLLVRETPTGLELLAGERRQRAALLAELETVPVRVLQADDTTAAAIALTENLAREDLTAWEEAQGIAALRDVLAAEGGRPTRDRLASMTGRSGGAVSESLAIADRITPEVVELSGVDRQSLTELPKTALHGASRGDTAAERARLLRTAADAEAPGKAVREHAREERPKRGRPQQPYTLQARKDGRVSFAIRRPSEIDPGVAREILERLEPVLQALRERATEE